MKKFLSALCCLALAFSCATLVYADFPWYSTLSELLQRANLVLVCVSINSWETYVDEIPRTTTSIEVMEVISGNGAQAGEIIEVYQSGHAQQSNPVTITPFHPLEIGQKYVLFLRDNFLLNPIQAQYLIDEAGNIISLPGNPIRVYSLDMLRSPPWWIGLPAWLQWILRYLFFGWIWMK